MAEEKPDMSLGELVEKIVLASVEYNNRLHALDGKGSPYASEKDLRQRLLEEYQRRVNPLKEELNRREQLYSRK